MLDDPDAIYRSGGAWYGCPDYSAALARSGPEVPAAGEVPGRARGPVLFDHRGAACPRPTGRSWSRRTDRTRPGRIDGRPPGGPFAKWAAAPRLRDGGLQADDRPRQPDERPGSGRGDRSRLRKRASSPQRGGGGTESAGVAPGPGRWASRGRWTSRWARRARHILDFGRLHTLREDTEGLSEDRPRRPHRPAVSR